MPKKKHRLSWLYEDLPAGHATQTLEEDTLAVSPVEVAYMSDVLAENAPIEELPEDAPAEAAPAEECSVVDEAAPGEECPILEEAPPPEEPPAADEELAADPLIEEARANSEPETVQQKDVLCKSEADRSDEEAARDAEKLDEKSGEVVLICTSCTTMLFIEHDGPCPYSVISLMGSCHESYSWFLHTTCFSCVNEQKHKWTSREQFSNECMAAFRAAILSEAFMKRTGWFEVACRVCRKPLQMAMDEGRRSVAYVKIDVVREETTGNCRMRGLRSVGLAGEKGERSELIDSFVPGGFM